MDIYVRYIKVFISFLFLDKPTLQWWQIWQAFFTESDELSNQDNGAI
jgi:hypothetical protein